VTDPQDSLPTSPNTDTASAPQNEAGKASVSGTSKKPGKSPKKVAKTKSTNWPIFILLLLLFSFCAAAGVYFWQITSQQNNQIVQLNIQKQSDDKRINQLERSVTQRLNSIDSQNSEQYKQLTKLDKQSLFNTQQLNELGASSRSDWLLAEAEYLLHLANQRLGLEQDFKGAEAILIEADKVLNENDDPGLLPIRQALASEILSLQQISKLDKEGIYVRLSALIGSLDRLNESIFIKQKKMTPSTEPPSEIQDMKKKDNTGLYWQTVWNDIRNDLEKVFSIRRLDQPIKPLLAPEQSYYLRQNLRLMLEQASLALLDKNTVIYQDSLEKAVIWTNSYFDLSDQKTQVLINSLDDLKAQKIAFSTPDISNSLRLLKTKIEEMYQNHTLGRLATPSTNTNSNSAVKEELK